MMPPVTTPYDALHYPSKPFRYTRPDRMELIARLHGLDPTPSPRARVLEIGCGTGGNLLPMGEAFPDTQFLGIDLAESQIAHGDELRAEAGIANVELRAMDLMDIDASFGEFDYIVAHGVYSWVPAPVKARLLDVISQRLSPRGIAYLSYNVKPGWYMKAAVRDLMRYHTQGYEDPREKVKQSRALLEFLLVGARENEVAWKEILKQQTEVATRIPDEVVFFDHLSDVNDACYFHEMAAELPVRGLEYLGDASFSSMVPNRIAPEAVRVLDQLGEDPIRREQYLDFLKNRQFRTSLFVRAGSPITRRIELRRAFDWHVASQAKPKDPLANIEGPDPVSFEVPNAVARVVPLKTKRAVADLVSRYPASRPFADLVADAGPDGAQLAIELFQLYTYDIVEMWLYPDTFATEAPPRPRATAISRALSKRGPRVSNLRHETVALDEDERRLLPLVDGTRDAEALAAALPGKDVKALLGTLARKALLFRS
jgi:SAM-dependent methyltransferase